MYISDLTYLEVATEINEVHGGGYCGWKKKGGKGKGKYGGNGGGDDIDVDIDQNASVKVDDISVKSYKSGGFSLNISASNTATVDL